MRSTGGSTIDLTISSDSATAWVSGWKVLSNFESLSDHAYVAFSFGEPRSSGRAASSSDQLRVVPLRSSLKSFDDERPPECLAAEAWRDDVAPGPARRSVHDMAREVRDDLRWISNSCMKRIGSRSISRKRPKYWWTNEIGELCKESCLARRRFVGKKRQLIKRGGRYEDMRVSRRSTPRASERRRFRLRGKKQTWYCWTNRAGIRRRRARTSRFVFSMWRASCLSA